MPNDKRPAAGGVVGSNRFRTTGLTSSRQPIQPSHVHANANCGVAGCAPAGAVSTPKTQSRGANANVNGNAASQSRLAQPKMAPRQPATPRAVQLRRAATPRALQLQKAPSQTQIATAQSQVIQRHGVVQLLQCGKCGNYNGHKPSCIHYVAPKKKGPKKTGTHKPGENHDDGSGFQKSGSGGDRHQQGLQNQITNANQNNFYRTGKRHK
jgi:hypothetical protein